MISNTLCKLMTGFNVKSVEELRALDNAKVNKILDIEEKRYNFIKEHKLDEPVEMGKPRGKETDPNFNAEKLSVDEDTFTVIERSVKQIEKDLGEKYQKNVIDFTAQLPKNLKKAQPRYKKIQLTFENDFQKALYIVGNPKKSATHYDEYLDFLKKNTELTEDEILSSAKQMRDDMEKLIGKGGPESFKMEDLKNKWVEEAPEEIANVLIGKKPHKVVMREASGIYNAFTNETKLSTKSKVSQILKDIKLENLDSTLTGFRTIMNEKGKKVEELLSIKKITAKETDEMLNLFSDLEIISRETKILQQNVARGLASGNIKIEDVLKVHSDIDYTSIKTPNIFSKEDRTMEDVYMTAVEKFRKAIGETPKQTDKQRQQIIQQLLDSNKMEDITMVFKNVREEIHIKGGTFKDAGFVQKLVDVLLESFRTSILSGPSTQVVNVAGSTIKLTTQKLENWMTYGFGKLSGKGSTKLSYEELKALNDNEVLTHMGKSFKNLSKSVLNKKTSKESEDILEQSQLDSYQQAENIINRAISGETFGLEGTMSGEAIDKLGRIIRTPYQVLGTVDDGFKRAAYSGKIKQIAIRESKKLPEGTTLKEINKFQKDFEEIYKKLKVEKTTNITDEEKKFLLKHYRQELHEEALHYARVQTFTEDIVPSDKSSLDIDNLLSVVEKARSKYTPLQFVLPFYKTPVNLIKWTTRRTPGLNLFSSEIRRKLAAGGVERDEVLAQMTMGTIIYGTFASMAFNEDDTGMTITGGVPYGQEKAWEIAGIQPYSIKIGDTWYQYNRLDPVATSLGLMADMAQFHNKMIARGKGDSEGYLEEIDELGNAIMLSISNNVASKTWMKGINDMMDAIKGKNDYFFKNLATSFVPFGSMAGEINREDTMKEAKTMLDILKKKYTTDLNRSKLNVFGEEVEEDRKWYGVKQKDSMEITKGLKELIRLEVELSPINNKFEYKGFEIELNDDDHHAMRRLLDTKFNLRDKLERLVNSPSYRKLRKDGISEAVKGTKKQMISRTISKHKSDVKNYFIKQNPELIEQYKQQKEKDMSEMNLKQDDFINKYFKGGY